MESSPTRIYHSKSSAFLSDVISQTNSISKLKQGYIDFFHFWRLKWLMWNLHSHIPRLFILQYPLFIPRASLFLNYWHNEFYCILISLVVFCRRVFKTSTVSAPWTCLGTLTHPRASTQQETPEVTTTVWVSGYSSLAPRLMGGLKMATDSTVPPAILTGQIVCTPRARTTSPYGSNNLELNIELIAFPEMLKYSSVAKENRRLRAGY